MVCSWSSNDQTSLKIPWKSTDQQDVHFHFYQIFPLVCYHSLFFWSFSHLPAKEYSEGKTGWRTAEEFPTKESYKCTCLPVVRQSLFQTQSISVIFNLPRNSSPAHFLELELLCVLWIYTFLHNFSHTSRDPQTPGKKITAFYTASQEMCFCPRCIGGHWPRKASHSLCTPTAWSFPEWNSNSSTAQAPAAPPTLNTAAKSDNVCKAAQGSWDESLLRLQLFTLRRMRWHGVHTIHRI